MIDKQLLERAWKKWKNLNPHGTLKQFAKDIVDTMEEVGKTMNQLEGMKKC